MRYKILRFVGKMLIWVWKICIKLLRAEYEIDGNETVSYVKMNSQSKRKFAYGMYEVKVRIVYPKEKFVSKYNPFPHVTDY